MSVVSTQVRKNLVAEINVQKSERAEMEDKYGKVWNTTELMEDFEVHGFMAPFVVVTQKGTGRKGSLMFQHAPRYYFSWKPDGE